MDKLLKDLLGDDLVETLLNKYTNDMLLSLAENDAQKDAVRKVIESFNRHGVSSFTVIKVLADAFKEGGFENG